MASPPGVYRVLVLDDKQYTRVIRTIVFGITCVVGSIHFPLLMTVGIALIVVAAFLPTFCILKVVRDATATRDVTIATVYRRGLFERLTNLVYRTGLTLALAGLLDTLIHGDLYLALAAGILLLYSFAVRVRKGVYARVRVKGLKSGEGTEGMVEQREQGSKAGPESRGEGGSREEGSRGAAGRGYISGVSGAAG